MIGVRERTYEASTPQDQEELMRLTIEELGKSEFPKEINVLIGQTEKTLTVIAIEPLSIRWDWPGLKPEEKPGHKTGEESGEKPDDKPPEGFARFSKGKRIFIAKF
jgi:hypothetical protein